MGKADDHKNKAAEMAGKPPKKSKPKPGTAVTTSISVDEKECNIADNILRVLEQEKGAEILRMLRVNRISVLRLAMGMGLKELIKKVESGESIL